MNGSDVMLPWPEFARHLLDVSNDERGKLCKKRFTIRQLIGSHDAIALHCRDKRKL